MRLIPPAKTVREDALLSGGILVGLTIGALLMGAWLSASVLAFTAVVILRLARRKP